MNSVQKTAAETGAGQASVLRCGACATVYPKNTIGMVADNEGFYFPQVVEVLSVLAHV